MYFANRMYKPSYISTHSALAFYGLIPEAVVQITSVSSLKTAQFENTFGTYTYQNILASLMFGFEAKPYEKGLYMLIAQPEKALLDLLYLNPYYMTWQDFEDLRIDKELFEDIISVEKLRNFAMAFKNKRIQSFVDGISKNINID
jgi:predicted transcriptional regulator of viral defense system